ncbi:hypothetical protein [Rosistilla oblonga]|uniref:hypothetical protein n=1 Tax=Rosistilla oblonga TaxID=2527990 RepID=UPI003A981260
MLEIVENAWYFAAHLSSESNRGCAIVAASLLDVSLEELLESRFPGHSKDLFGNNDPLGTFSAKIRMARALSIVNSAECFELNTIRKIRNRFAHELDNGDWSKSPIVDWVHLLRAPKALGFEFDDRKVPLQEPPERWTFQMSVACLMLALKFRTTQLVAAEAQKVQFLISDEAAMRDDV